MAPGGPCRAKPAVLALLLCSERLCVSASRVSAPSVVGGQCSSGDRGCLQGAECRPGGMLTQDE